MLRGKEGAGLSKREKVGGVVDWVGTRGGNVGEAVR